MIPEFIRAMCTPPGTLAGIPSAANKILIEVRVAVVTVQPYCSCRTDNFVKNVLSLFSLGIYSMRKESDPWVEQNPFQNGKANMMSQLPTL